MQRFKLRQLKNIPAAILKSKYAKLAGILAGYTVFLFFLLFLLAAHVAKVSFFEFLLLIAPQKSVVGKTILAVGLDDTEYVQRSDTIMVMYLDTINDRIGVVSVPRDTYVNVKGVGFTKINHAYAYGGIKLLSQTVSEFLNVPIDYYVVVDIRGMSELIDSLGGIEIDVPKDLQYTDKAGHLAINLKKGKQVLTGSQAVQYLRFRHDTQGDIGRVHRQQEFIQAVSAKLLNVRDIWSAPGFIKQISQYIKTNMSLPEMVGLAVQLNKSMGKHSIQMGTVPGGVTLSGGVSYWRPDIVQLDRVVEEVLLGFKINEVSLAKVDGTPDKEASRENRRLLSLKDAQRVTSRVELKSEPTFARAKIAVEVLNGTGIPGQAEQAAKKLRQKGYHVVSVGNASTYTYIQTRIVDWRGEVQKALEMASLLSIDPNTIILYDKSDKPLDLTLVVGKDWDRIELSL